MTVALHLASLGTMGVPLGESFVTYTFQVSIQHSKYQLTTYIDFT